MIEPLTVLPSADAVSLHQSGFGRALVVLVMLLAALLSGGGSSADAVELHDVSAAARGGCSRPATFALEALDVGVGSRRPRFVGVAGSWDGTLPPRRDDGLRSALARPRQQPPAKGRLGPQTWAPRPHACRARP